MPPSVRQHPCWTSLDPFGGSRVTTNMADDSKLHLRIASPCKAPWENMDGDERVRFCRECNRNVYNLSVMTGSEARHLIAEREGRLCVRFYQRRDGTVLTSDCPVAQRRSFLRTGAGTALALATIATSMTSVSACDSPAEDITKMGEPLMGSPPIDTDWDAGEVDHTQTQDPDEFIMGDIEYAPEPALMGKIAPPAEVP